MAEDEKEQAARAAAIEAAISSADMPNFYITGFKNGLGPPGVVVVGELNGKSTVVLNMSHSMAKTLAVKLTEMISKMEHALGMSIPTQDEMEAKLRGSLGRPKPPPARL